MIPHYPRVWFGFKPKIIIAGIQGFEPRIHFTSSIVRIPVKRDWYLSRLRFIRYHSYVTTALFSDALLGKLSS